MMGVMSANILSIMYYKWLSFNILQIKFVGVAIVILCMLWLCCILNDTVIATPGMMVGPFSLFLL